MKICLEFLLVAATIGAMLPGAGRADAAPQACPDVHVVVVPGTTDSSLARSPDDNRSVLGPTVMAAAAQGGATTAVSTVPYPADFGYSSTGTTYFESVAIGVSQTNAQLAEVNRQCGDRTDLMIVGYSQGADVAHRVASQIGTGNGAVPASRVRGVYLFSDPNRGIGDSMIAGSPDACAPGPGVQSNVCGLTPSIGGGMEPNRYLGFGALTGRVVSLCNTGDFACAVPENTEFARIIANVVGQMHLDLNDPVQIASDLGKALLGTADRAAAMVLTTDGWMHSAQTLQQVVLLASDPLTPKPSMGDVAPTHVAAFAADIPGALLPKIRHEVLADATNNLGIVDMAVEPSYWYPGPSHISYFTTAIAPGRHTAAAQVSTWMAESISSVRSDPTPQSVTVPAEPLPAPPAVAAASAPLPTIGEDVGALGDAVNQAVSTTIEHAPAVVAQAGVEAEQAAAQVQQLAPVAEAARTVSTISTSDPVKAAFGMAAQLVAGLGR